MRKDLENYLYSLKPNDDFVVVHLGDLNELMIALGSPIKLLDVLSIELLNREIVRTYKDDCTDFIKVVI